MHTQSVPAWTITLLGGLEAVPQGQSRTITRFRTHKYGALLGYLAYHISAVHSRDMVIALLWSEMSEKAGRNNLSVALSSLRNQLEPPGTPTGSIIVADRFHIGLNAASVTTDAARFEEALGLAKETGSAIKRGQCLSRAIDLYHGPLLKGYEEEWIAGERERLAGLFFGALGQRIRDLEADGDLLSALAQARKAVTADPLREEGRTHLIRLLAAAGEPDQALRQFREFKRLLKKDVGDEPSAPLWDLIRRIETKEGIASHSGAALSRSKPVLTKSRVIGTGVDIDETRVGSQATLTFLMVEITDRKHRGGGTSPLHSPLEVCRHIVREALSRHEIVEASESGEAGEAFTAAFTHAGAALSCAVRVQRDLQAYPWQLGTKPLRIRMALHTGDAEVKSGSARPLRDQAVHRTSHMLTAAHGGQILLSEATTCLVRGNLNQGTPSNEDEISLTDMGIHRLPDVWGAEHLFQVNYPGMDPAEFPPLVAEPGCDPNLPTAVTRFFGRRREIAELMQMLRGAPWPLVTLTGAGGTGKTRLASETAQQLVTHFGGAVFFVPLAGIADPALIPDAILSVLRLPRSPQRDPLDQAVETLAKQPTLLVLDNLEHLIDGGTKIVEALLSRLVTLKVLVTSRQALDLPLDGVMNLF